jgi:hypothetical protein
LADDGDLAPEAGQPAYSVLPDPIHAQASSVGDSAAAVDELGFELYVNALADFLVAPNTRAPLTCSVEGSWGSGKSSFMLQLKNRLKAVAPTSRTIEFNAWKYDKQEELWAAFALKVTRSLREQLSWTQRLRGDLHLFATRIKGWNERLSLLALVLAWLLLLTGFGGVIAWTIHAERHERVRLIKALSGVKQQSSQPPGKTSASEPGKASPETPPLPDPPLPDPWYDWLSWSPLATSTILILLISARIPASLRKRLFEAQLEKYIDKPDYKGKAAFVDAFSDDFAKTIAAYAPDKDAKVFVFIDDLDRCEAPKAADLMQAMNLMIGDGNSLIFILGLDRTKVAAAIAFKFRDIIPYLDPSLVLANPAPGIRSFGDAFLEKFIQLSFRLPISSNDTQARRFIDSLIGGAPSSTPAVHVTATSPLGKLTPEEAAAAAAESKRRALRIESGAESQRIRDIVLMVREVLDYSPRRIKAFLNAFRLALYIASTQGLLDVDLETGRAEVTPEQLGKFLVLTSRYPELRSALGKDPDFLEKLENTALDWIADSDGTIDTFLEKPGVRRLMNSGIVDKTLTWAWSRQYSMKDFPFRKFDTVVAGVPPPPKARSQSPKQPVSKDIETPARESRQVAAAEKPPASAERVPERFSKGTTASRQSSNSKSQPATAPPRRAAMKK